MRTKPNYLLFFAVLILGFSMEQGAQTITLPSALIGTSSNIPASFSNAPGLPDEWMGLHPYMGSGTSYICWQYLGSQVNGTLIFPAPPEKAAYNFRMFGAENNLLCVSEPFAVKKSLFPDDGFNGTGIIHSDFSGNGVDDWGECVAIDSDQHIIVAGAALNGDSINGQIPIIRFVVGRYNPDGTPDLSFGINGKVSTLIPGIDAIDVHAMVVQADGKIVVGGSGINYGIGLCLQQGSFVLVRYGTSGALDPGFGTNGVVLTNFTQPAEPVGNSSDKLTALELQPDGKLLAGGYGEICHEGGLRRCDLVRYHPNGQLDAGFGTAGKITFHPSMINEWVEAIAPPALNGDGSFYVAANLSPWLLFYANENRFYKFDSQGNLVTSFGTGGLVTDPRPALANSQYPRCIAIGPDNQLYVMGCTGNYGLIWLMKMDPLTGASDPWFGNNGVVVYEHPVACIPTGMEFYDNRLVIGHHTLNGIWSASRFLLNGEFDHSFGWPGTMVHDYADDVRGFALQQDGKVLMAGSGVYAPGQQRDLMVVKFDTNSTRFLQNEVINYGQNPCFASNENLYTYNVAIESGALLNLIAADRIFLYEGTTVLPGGHLQAKISNLSEDCTDKSALLSSGNKKTGLPDPLITGKERTGQLNVYPNPTSGVVFIDSGETNGWEGFSLELYGVMGNKITAEKGSGMITHQMDLSGLNSGIYFIKISTSRNTTVLKVVKQ